MAKGKSPLETISALPNSIIAFFDKPSHFFIAAGAILMLSAVGVFDAMLGVSVASIGIWYKFN